MTSAFVSSCSNTRLVSRNTFCGAAVESRTTRQSHRCARTNRVHMLGEVPVAKPFEGESFASEGAGEPDAAQMEVPPVAETQLEVAGEDVEDVVPCMPPQYVQNAAAIDEARAKFKLHETDTGSPEYQIATLSTRITYLTNHLKVNPKDYSSTRGLLKMVSTRRRLLKYVKKQDPARFDNIISGLGIRVSQQLRGL